MAVMPLHEAIRRAYKGRARQEDLAPLLDVGQPTISRWSRGETMPDVDQIALLENAVGRPRGFILHAAGYIDDVVSVEEAIDMDPGLGDDDRATLITLYRHLLRGDGE